MRNFLAALQFLTLFPLSGDYCLTADRKTASAYFPLIGLLIGIVLAALDWGLGYIFPVSLRSACILAALFLMTGGLHLDGLADSADGFMSGKPKEDIFRIMKDSRSGAMAVSAVGCALIIQFAALSALPRADRVAAIVLFPAAGRAAIVLVMGLFPIALEAGSTHLFSDRPRAWLAVFSGMFLIVSGWAGAGAAGAAAAVFVLITAWLAGLYIKRKLGGYTGDTLGAVCVISEISFLLALIAAALP
ncbi:MAG: cobalamin 5'-phosphate synthase [Elusimicrobia bacterium RIFCSPLOWO2_01_FULL_54_10]|nr:MAG: cobalamin 5'-phosphate synthase [Elusimicrobia bacterium RIFCSPLOWO2_01_FULL_54_10]